MVYTKLPITAPQPEPNGGALPPIPQGHKLPVEGQLLLIELPGERLRATVRKVVASEYLIAELTEIPLAKSHHYQKGDFVPCELVQLSHEWIWRAYRPASTMPEFPVDVPKSNRNRARIADRDRRRPQKKDK